MRTLAAAVAAFVRICGVPSAAVAIVTRGSMGGCATTHASIRQCKGAKLLNKAAPTQEPSDASTAGYAGAPEHQKQGALDPFTG